MARETVIDNKLSNIVKTLDKIEKHLEKINGRIDQHGESIVKINTRQDSQTIWLRTLGGAVIVGFIGWLFTMLK